VIDSSTAVGNVAEFGLGYGNDLESLIIGEITIGIRVCG
jgi:hypothetical protein